MSEKKKHLLFLLGVVLSIVGFGVSNASSFLSLSRAGPGAFTRARSRGLTADN